jgi:hypothetical protein
MPNITHSPTVLGGTWAITPSRSLVCKEANSHGASSQEKIPPVSQKISHDQRRTPR